MAKRGRPEGLTPSTQRELALSAAFWELWRADGATKAACVRLACDVLAPSGTARMTEKKSKRLVSLLGDHGAAYFRQRVYASADDLKPRQQYAFIRASIRLAWLVIASPNRHDAAAAAAGMLEIGWDDQVTGRLLAYARLLNRHSCEYKFIGPTSQNFRLWLAKHPATARI